MPFSHPSLGLSVFFLSFGGPLDLTLALLIFRQICVVVPRRRELLGPRAFETVVVHSPGASVGEAGAEGGGVGASRVGRRLLEAGGSRAHHSFRGETSERVARYSTTIVLTHRPQPWLRASLR